MATVTRNHPELVYVMTAANGIGMVAIPIDPRSKGEKLGYMLDNSKARAVITTPDLLEEVEKVSRHINRIERIWLNLKPNDDSTLADAYPTTNEILAGPDVYELDDRIDDPSLPMEIIYTSGVTVNPKGVVIKGNRTLAYSALAQMVWGSTEESVLYTGLSLTHGNAQAVTLIGAIALGIPAVISQRFTKRRIWDVCRT